MFWEKEDDERISIVYEAQSPNNFEHIKTFTLFTDNNQLNASDKFAKVQMLYDIKNKNNYHTHYSLDEQMVPYNGERSCKQIIRMKSIRFGHKNVFLMSSNGQPYFVDPYYGKKYSEGKD